MGNKSARKHTTPEEQRRAANEAEWVKPRPPLIWEHGNGQHP